MHRSSLQTSWLAAALVALAGCTGTDIERTGPATTPITMTSSQPSSAAAATTKLPRIDTEAPAEFQTATFALG